MVWIASHQNERNLMRYRILLLLGAVLYPAWWFVFRWVSPEAVDPPLSRLCIALALLATYGFTFVSGWVTRNVNRLILLCACLLTAHYFFLLHLNARDTNYVIVAFVVVFAVSCSFISRRQIVFYAALVAAMSAALCVIHDPFPKTVFLTGMATGLGVAYIALASRLELIESLLESEKRFRTLADNAPVMIWMSDERGACHFFNEIWLKFTGLSMDNAAGNGWTKSIHAEDLNGYLEKYFTAFRARRPFHAEYRLRRADGEYRWVFGQSVPIYEPSGRFEGYIGSCVDITARKQEEPAKP